MLDTVGLRGSPRDCFARVRRWSGRTLGALAALSLAAPTMALPAFPPQPAPSAATPQPAMWVVSDEDTTIFLFGTFHALDNATDWFGPRIQAAFAVSDELVLETVVPTDPGEVQAALVRHQLMSAPVPGQPVIAGGASRPMVAAAGQAVAAGKAMGMSVEGGADAVLRRAAERLGKRVDGLESFDFQVGMFTTLATHPAPPVATAPQAPLGNVLADMRSSWKAGDAGRFAAMLGTIERQSPDTYRVLFAERNERWAQWIAHRLDQPGTAFVAVGAGHFVGRDSVQAKLSHHGIRASRVS